MTRMDELLDSLPATSRMPVLFIGHGSPMNALADNAFTRSLRQVGVDMPRPSAVLVVSAHWLTHGTRVLCARSPRTIHDFYGFPPELYALDYPAEGGISFARAAARALGAPCDDTWGLDHAAWAVMRHMFPDADIPVFEVSLDMGLDPEEHHELAARLAPLRDRGVLVVGSGNVVHNLGAMRWDEGAEPFDWAVAFDAWVRDRLIDDDTAALLAYEETGRIAELAVPTNEHYLPFLYAAALRDPGDELDFTYEGIDLASVSMRCVRFTPRG